MSSGRTVLAALGGTLALFTALVVGVVAVSGQQSDATATDVAAPATPTAVAEPAPSARLTLALEQPRYLQLTKMLEVIVRNEGEEPVEVVHVGLDPGSRFASAEGRVTATDFDPGQRIDMKVAYGDVDCADRPVRPPSVKLDVRTADGTVEQFEAEPGDGDALLGRIHDGACAAQALQAAVTVGFGEDWSVEGETAHGTVALRRQSGEGPVTLVEAGGTVIFGLHADPDREVPYATMRSDAEAAEVPVAITADRCDPHAVADSKKTFQFRAWVALDGADEVFLEIVPGPQGRAVLDQILEECIARGARVRRRWRRAQLARFRR